MATREQVRELAGEDLPQENPTSSDTVKRWLAGRASADAQMRSAAEQASLEREPAQENKDRDAIDVLGRDHLRVRALIKLLSGTPSHNAGGTAADLARRKTLVEMITAKLTRHEAAESELLWPVVRSALPDGDTWADTARQQEQEGSDTLAALGKLEPDSDDFDEHVEQLIGQVRKHVAYESKVFGMLREAMSARQRQRLGKRLVTAMQRHEADEQAQS